MGNSIKRFSSGTGNEMKQAIINDIESTSKGSEYISIANCKVSGVEPLEKIGSSLNGLCAVSIDLNPK